MDAGGTVAGGAFERWRQRSLRVAPADSGEVVLRHSRIYILPTRRGLALVATIATMVVTSLNYALALGFAVAFLLAGLAAAALLHVFRNLAGLRVRAGPVGEAFAGGSLRFALDLGGGGRARTAIVVEARGTAAQAVDVDAEGATPVALDVPAPHRGRVPLGRITLASDVPLGLWRGWSYVHFPAAGLAYPCPEAGAPPLPAALAAGDAAGDGRDEDGDLGGLREYRHGDPLQRVAWKTVARGGGWYTKTFDRSGGGALVLDYHALPAALPAERRLARLTAWVLACERAARPCGLRLPGARIAPGLGRDHRRALLAALALHDAPPA